VTSRTGAGTRIYVSVPIEPIATEPVAAALQRVDSLSALPRPRGTIEE
jgi:hypothetical protein